MIENFEHEQLKDNMQEEQLAPLGATELSVIEYIKRAELIPEVFDWFDYISIRALTINEESRSSVDENKIFSSLPVEKIGQVHAVKPEEAYLNLIDERRHRAKSLIGEYNLGHTDYWVEVAVAMQDDRLITHLLDKTIEIIDEDERYADDIKHQADSFRRNLLGYVRLIDGLTRLKRFKGLWKHFERLDQYWLGKDEEHYFDWLNHEDQMADTVKNNFRRPARKSLTPGVVRLSNDLTNLDESSNPSNQHLQTNKEFFDLLDRARSSWVGNQLDGYDNDQSLPGDVLDVRVARINTESLNVLGVDAQTSQEIYRQINLITNPELQRKLHYRLYWLQPTHRKQTYVQLPEVAPLFNTRDDDVRLWQPSLLRSELKLDSSLLSNQREKLKERIGKSEGFKLPSTLNRLIEQFEINPGSGPFRQLTEYALRDGKIHTSTGLSVLEQCQLHLPHLRALGEFEFNDVVRCINSLALSASRQDKPSLMLRFMFEAALLTGEQKDLNAYLEAESQFQDAVSASDEDVIKQRTVQYAFDWSDYFKAESEFRKQKHTLSPKQRIEYGLQLLRLAINNGYEQEKAGSIVAEINDAYANLDATANSEPKRKETSIYQPLNLYKFITSPSPRQVIEDKILSQ